MYRIFLGSIFICLLSGSVMFGENNNDSLERILTGISQNASIIKNISFDYSIDYRLSELWKAKKLESMQKQLKERGLSEQFLRAPDNENTLRTGNFIRTAGAFKITNKIAAIADNKVFMDESNISDGMKLTKIDKRTNSALISNLDEYRNADISFYPDNFQNLFLGGKTLHTVFESNGVDFAYAGRQVYEGTECEILEITNFFTTPEGIKNFTKSRVWIASQNGFLIKRGISFKDDPNRPINSVTTEFKEVSEGIWYYSKILFESFPSENIKPDVTMCLTISEIKINQPLPKETFVPDLTTIPNITDKTKQNTN
jgi:hypothetical protein